MGGHPVAAGGGEPRAAPRTRGSDGQSREFAQLAAIAGSAGRQHAGQRPPHAILCRVQHTHSPTHPLTHSRFRLSLFPPLSHSLGWCVRPRQPAVVPLRHRTSPAPTGRAPKTAHTPTSNLPRRRPLRGHGQRRIAAHTHTNKIRRLHRRDSAPERQERDIGTSSAFNFWLVTSRTNLTTRARRSRSAEPAGKLARGPGGSN
jgi:hypothetical protein